MGSEHQGGFYKLLYDLIVNDDTVKRYRKELDALRDKKKEILARAEAEANLVDQKIKVRGALEKRRVDLITKRFLELRRKELGLKPIKPELPVAK